MEDEMSQQLESLKRILNERPFCPEILIEEDGDIGLDWHAGKMTLTVSISDNGSIAWAYINGETDSHGTSIESVIHIINSQEFDDCFMDVIKRNTTPK